MSDYIDDLVDKEGKRMKRGTIPLFIRLHDHFSLPRMEDLDPLYPLPDCPSAPLYSILATDLTSRQIWVSQFIHELPFRATWWPLEAPSLAEVLEIGQETR